MTDRARQALAASLALMAVALLVVTAGQIGVAKDAPQVDPYAKTVGGYYLATPTALTDGDYDALRLDSSGRLRVVAENTTISLGAAADVTVIAALPAGDNNIGNVDVVTQLGEVSFTVNQVAVGAAEVAVAAANATRRAIVVKNIDSTAVFVGGSGVLTTTGFRLGQNEEIRIETTAGVSAIGAGAGASVSFLEEHP